MKYFFTATISRTVVFVVLLSVLPALCIIIATGMERYNSSVHSAQERGKSFVRIVTERQNQIAENVATITAALAQVHEVRAHSAAAVTRLFGDLLAVSPVLSNIFLLDARGDVVASALPPPGPLNFSGQAFFKHALHRDDFSVGQVVSDLVIKGLTLQFARPVHSVGEGGLKRISGLIAADLDLSRYGDMLAGLDLPKGATIYLADGTGALAAVYPPQPSAAPGDMLRGEAWRIMRNLAEPRGHFFVASEGQPRQFAAYQKLYLRGMDQPYLQVLFLIPEDTAYAEPRALMQRDLLLFAAAALMALVAAWGFSSIAFLRSLHMVLAAATALAGGDFSARVPETRDDGEIGALGREFNIMGEALGKRDRELSSARDLADEGSKAKSEFLANMSHEIRTPMNAILGLAYLALKTDLSQQQQGYLSKLLTAANTLLRVINDILDFSKLEAGKLSMERIGFSLRRIVNTVRGEAADRLGEKSLSFQTDIPSQVPDQLIGDPLRLSQALTALVDEAVNRSERGDIFFVCSVLNRESAAITLQFIVRDASIGLTPMQLAELRQIFDREPHAAQGALDGSRLSLTICHRLFRMMGGAISVESDFGRGTVFTATARFGYTTEISRQRYSLFEGESVLIVDDSELSRHGLTEMLDQFGFEVQQAAALEQAMAILIAAEEQGRPFAVLFVDWRISSQGMLDRLRRIKISPHLKKPPAVILTTGQGRASVPDSLEKLGLDAFLHKPVNGSVLFDILVNIFSVQDLGVQAGPPAAEAENGVHVAGMRVLLVEDNAINQQIAEEILRGEGIVVSVAENGRQALEMIGEELPPRFDLVLMDLQMPEMDGVTATRAIRANPAFHAFALPVVAMTAHSDMQEITACLSAGMNDHTTKPITVEQLFLAIRRWLPLAAADGAYVREAVAAMRGQLVGKDPASLLRLEKDLTALLPYIHEGRVMSLRALLTEGDEASLMDMFDKLENMTRAGDSRGEE